MIRELLEQISGYPGLFLVCVASGIVVPLPEDFPLLYAGARIADGSMAWPATISVGLVGVLLRDVIAWGVGRSLGSYLLHRPWVRRLLGERKLDRAHDLICDHGASAILIGRFLVGFRAPMFVVAGAMDVRLAAFVGWDLLGLLLVVPLTIGLGFAFGAPLADSVFWVLQRARIAVGIVTLLAVLWLAWRMWSRRSSEVAEPPAS